jgi:hypothetical protein
MQIIYDENTFGITQDSLKMLRDTLASRINHHIAIFEIPTSDLCCGFLILDKDADEVIFSGDGFRQDRAGEGGAGYKTAEILFRLFGMKTKAWEMVDFTQAYQGNKEVVEQILKELVEKISKEYGEELKFRRPIDSMPQYIKNVL